MARHHTASTRRGDQISAVENTSNKAGHLVGDHGNRRRLGRHHSWGDAVAAADTAADNQALTTPAARPTGLAASRH